MDKAQKPIILHDITYFHILQMIVYIMTALWTLVMQNLTRSTWDTHCKGPDITARPVKQSICLPKSDRQATYCVYCAECNLLSCPSYTWRIDVCTLPEVPSDSFHSADKLRGRTTTKCNIRSTGEKAPSFNFDSVCRNCANTLSAQVQHKPSWETNNRSAGQ